MSKVPRDEICPACCGHGKELLFIMMDCGDCLYGQDAEEYAGWLFKFVTDMNMYSERGLTF
jgi:hypothetical protein